MNGASCPAAGVEIYFKKSIGYANLRLENTGYKSATILVKIFNDILKNDTYISSLKKFYISPYLMDFNSHLWKSKFILTHGLLSREKKILVGAPGIFLEFLHYTFRTYKTSRSNINFDCFEVKL